MGLTELGLGGESVPRAPIWVGAIAWSVCVDCRLGHQEAIHPHGRFEGEGMGRFGAPAEE